jgi:hypothetical protein
MGSATHDKPASRRRGFGQSHVRVLRHALLGVALISAIGFTNPASAGAAVALKATVTLTPSSATINQVVTAGLANSTRPAGDMLSKITLTWGDGSKAVTLANLSSRPAHRYVRPGHFTVTASLTDQHGITVHGSAVEVVTPPAGSYAGQAVGVNYGAPVKFYVSGNHAQVQDVSIPTLYLNCMPGNTWPSDAIAISSIPLSAGGSFSSTSTQSGVWNGNPATFTYVFRGHFHGVDASGTPRAAGLVRETVTFTDTTAHTCTSNNIGWAVTRDAQPAQPTTLPPNGNYSGSALDVNYGAPVTFTVSGATLQTVSLPNVYMDCAPGAATAFSPISVSSIALNADGSFNSTTTQSGVYNGHAATFTYVFNGHFHGVDHLGNARAAGQFSETLTFTDTAARTCMSNDHSWTAAL